jgi:hypothetical protein
MPDDPACGKCGHWLPRGSGLALCAACSTKLAVQLLLCYVCAKRQADVDNGLGVCGACERSEFGRHLFGRRAK